MVSENKDVAVVPWSGVTIIHVIWLVTFIMKQYNKIHTHRVIKHTVVVVNSRRPTTASLIVTLIVDVTLIL